MPFFMWLESTAIARTVGESLWLTAWLSAIHVIGFTLVMGSAVLINLRLLEAVLPQSDVVDVLRPGSRALLIGIAISSATGLLLFLPRASYTSINSVFQLKMLLIVASLLFQYLVVARIATAPQSNAIARKLIGVSGLALWLGLALTASWFILFE